ncbi:MAG: cell wall metabolism sensor histidine kinase WalK [Lachnospiraceae bacterium]|nr:cell wall metabolism sensor histidine kinase WalK [Lachnospiraceae bacterium]
MDFFKHSKSIKSIRVNLLITIVCMGVIPIVVLLIAMLSIYNISARESKAREVKNYANIAADMLSDMASVSDTDFLENNDTASNGLMNKDLSAMDIIADVYGGRVIVVDANLVMIKDTNIKVVDSTISTINYNISRDVNDCIKDDKQILADRDDLYTELITPVHDANNKVIGAVVLGYSNKNISSMYDVLKNKFLIIITIVIIIVILAGIHYSSKISSSFKKITKSIDEVNEGFLDAIEPVNDFAETKDLSEAFNSMLERIQSLENSRQEFVSNVSHELKTPITSMKVLADSLISQENIPAELYREFMVDITDELERENKIITDLLALVKLDKTASDLNIANININELLEMILKRVRPIASKRNIEITYESLRDVTADVDEVKLSLAFSNLIENAVKYNYENGWIRVTLNADHKYFYVRVADSGVGIPKDCQEKIFDRFYRVDKARSRDTGGTGLGLAITKSVIILHKGAIRVVSEEKKGTTFTIRIPITFVKQEENEEEIEQ